MVTMGVSASRLERLGKVFWRVVLDRGSLYMKLEGTDYLNICDNISCERTVDKQECTSRQCSGCSSVMYCSQSCQSLDWDAFHRAECLDARAHYLKQKEAGTSYSHRSRAFHAKYIEKRYRDRIRVVTDAVNGGRGINTFYPLLDCSSLEEPLKLLDICDSRKETWLSRPGTTFVQGYLEPALPLLWRPMPRAG
ncbi:hypothetical protein FA13DRAFT_1265039 [Coprinellus micaceus]|uniref:MYND-type domain-containing protein n=1 Tax=Coprinellus micaceus TaxID=71717 RepID=A0A4Y7R935_COPMI|nr:hypothetical protein FA13DRAFT_1265039 [Coprinellus micaceus]